MRPLILIVPLVFLCAGCKEEEPTPDPIRPVLTMTITPLTTEMFGPFAGTIEARYQSQLGFQTSGRMVARDVYVGDIVKKGQRLAALDPTVAQFALTRAKADVADSQAQLTNASGVESRQRTLNESGATPQASLDNAVASRDTAKARLDQALASLKSAQDQLGYSNLYASYEGVIASWDAEIGQFVSNGQAVVTEARLDEREASVDIPDDLIAKVSIGMSFKVSPQAAPTISADAIVREIGPLADSSTRTHRVRLTLKDPPEVFRFGTTVSLATENQIAPRILVPHHVIMSEDNHDWVWVVASDGHSVRRQAVTLADSSDGMVLIKSGLSKGDRIVTVGVHSLKDGQAVDGTKSPQQIVKSTTGGQP